MSDPDYSLEKKLALLNMQVQLRSVVPGFNEIKRASRLDTHQDANVVDLKIWLKNLFGDNTTELVPLKAWAVVLRLLNSVLAFGGSDEDGLLMDERLVHIFAEYALYPYEGLGVSIYNYGLNITGPELERNLFETAHAITTFGDKNMKNIWEISFYGRSSKETLQCIKSLVYVLGSTVGTQDMKKVYDELTGPGKDDWWFKTGIFNKKSMLSLDPYGPFLDLLNRLVDDIHVVYGGRLLATLLEEQLAGSELTDNTFLIPRRVMNGLRSFDLESKFTESSRTLLLQVYGDLLSSTRSSEKAKSILLEIKEHFLARVNELDRIMVEVSPCQERTWLFAKVMRRVYDIAFVKFQDQVDTMDGGGSVPYHKIEMAMSSFSGQCALVQSEINITLRRLRGVRNFISKEAQFLVGTTDALAGIREPVDIFAIPDLPLTVGENLAIDDKLWKVYAMMIQSMFSGENYSVHPAYRNLGRSDVVIERVNSGQLASKMKDGVRYYVVILNDPADKTSLVVTFYRVRFGTRIDRGHTMVIRGIAPAPAELEAVYRFMHKRLYGTLGTITSQNVYFFYYEDNWFDKSHATLASRNSLLISLWMIDLFCRDFAIDKIMILARFMGADMLVKHLTTTYFNSVLLPHLNLE